jgi:hypothetical protein
MAGVRLPEFWPSEPNYTISLLGQKVTLGNASNGLCGGMAYTVADLYLARRLPPPDTANRRRERRSSTTSSEDLNTHSRKVP